MPVAPPEAAPFLAAQEATKAGDWRAIYALFSPSERAAAQKRWDALRQGAKTAGSVHKSVLDGLAVEVQQSAAAVRAMDLPAYFTVRNEAQARSSPGNVRAYVAAQIMGIDRLSDDAAMLRIKIGEHEQQVPLKQEGGRWYLSRTLDALTDFEQ